MRSRSQRHEWGRVYEGGCPPLTGGGLGELPQRFFLFLRAQRCNLVAFCDNLGKVAMYCFLPDEMGISDAS